MAFYQNPPHSGPPQSMYGDATQTSSYQAYPPNPQQQPQQHHQQQPQHHQQQQFFSGPRGYPQFHGQQVQGGQASPPPNQAHNPNFYQPPPQPHHPQQSPQVHAFPPQNQLHQQQQQNSHTPQPQQFQNQFTGYGSAGAGDASSMAPPSSTGPMSMNMNAGATMQPGHAQRPQQPHAQMHARGNNPQMQFPSQDPSMAGWNTPTPPASAAGKTFLGQPSPSPTKTSQPGMPPSAPTSIPSASPQVPNQSLPGQPQNPSQKPQNTPPQRAMPQPPLSAEETKRQSQRVNVLLEINRTLLQAVIALQAAGRTGNLGKQEGGQGSPTVSESGEKTGAPDGAEGDGAKKTISSREYVECMRRIQANLGYLTVIGNRAHNVPEKMPPNPAIMDTLPEIQGNQMPKASLEELKGLYKQLRDLYLGAVVPPGGAVGVKPGQGGGMGGMGQVQSTA